MECHTSFSVPYDNKEIRHENIDCKAASAFIENLSSRYKYLSNVEIIRSRRFFPERNGYALLSHAQFKCLLNCATEKKTYWQHRTCQTFCLDNLVEYVLLNPKDAILYEKHSPD